jgi:hypothetical protein
MRIASPNDVKELQGSGDVDRCIRLTTLIDSIGINLNSEFVSRYSVIYYRVRAGKDDSQIFALFRPRQSLQRDVPRRVTLDGPGLVRTGPFLVTKARGIVQPVTLWMSSYYSSEKTN